MSNEEDDLNAFFEEVSAAEEEALTSKPNEDSPQNKDITTEPTTKKPKLDDTTSNNVIPPKKIVVAASAAVSKSSKRSNGSSLAASAIESNIQALQYNASQVSSIPSTNPNTPNTATTAISNNNLVKYQHNQIKHVKGPSIKEPTKRKAAGKTWEDQTLSEFPANDYRLFVGNLAKDIKVQQLEAAFSKYPSFALARICVNKADNKSRGYGFVSFLDAMDAARAIREMDQSWLGSRPIRVRRSDWVERSVGGDTNTDKRGDGKHKKKKGKKK